MTTAPRKLATIVALDVAGYSARTEADEAKTTAEVATLRGVIEGIANTHGGRVFNTAGDGFMLEFASSIAAVEAAFELAEKCQPKVRVGVHVGDVVPQPNGDLLGHGVNVAARLMARAEPGSTLISADVKRMIRGPVAERLQSCGTFKLDKMAVTIEAFALAAVASATVAMPTKSAELLLAVLPFDNLSNDPEMQFFSDGVSEEILQVLARSAGLKVIGRTSAFQFRGARKSEAARMLRATHALDGSVRKAGVRLRVSAQLTETAGGSALWSERYDGDLTDIFAMQDAVAAKVASSLRAVLTPTLSQRKIDPHVHELYLRALQERSSVMDDGYRRAQPLLEEAVAIAPDFADAWALLGAMRTMLLPGDRDSIGTPEHSAAMAATRRALALNPENAIAYWSLMNLKPAFGEYEERLALARRANELARGDSLPGMNLVGALALIGRCKDTLPLAQATMALDPMNPFNASGLARLLEVLGHVDEAHAHLDAVMKVQAPNLWTATARFMLYFNAGRLAEAAAFIDTSILRSNEEIGRAFRFLLALPSMSVGQRLPLFESMLGASSDAPLGLAECNTAAHFGCADLVFDTLFSAINRGRTLTGWRVNSVHMTRASTLSFVFALADGRALRADKRFATFCARIGLAEFWRESGLWPDCADEVPYDFKAECERAAAEVTKA